MTEKDILTGIAFVCIGLAMVCAAGWRRTLIEREYWKDKAEGTQCDLDYAVEVCFKRGATEFVRLNYPKHFAKLSKPAERSDAAEDEEG